MPGHQACPFSHEAGVVAEDLDAERPVAGGTAEQFERLFPVPDKAVHAYHFGETESRSLFPSHEPHWEIGDTRHGGEQQVAVEGQRADCQGSGHLNRFRRRALMPKFWA